MTPSNEKYVLHLDLQTILLSEGEPRLDMLDNPFAELTLSKSVLT
jgi:hypothetical protein